MGIWYERRLRVEELGVEELVPRVLEAREAPVDAVGVRLGVRQLRRRGLAPLLLVDGGVRVLAVHGHLRDVEERERHVGAVAVQDLPDHLHHAPAAVRAPVPAVLDHRRLVVAVAARRVAPVLTPARRRM